MLINMGANVSTKFSQTRDKIYVKSTPLSTACRGPGGPLNMTSTLRILLDAGADVNGRCVAYFDGTPLIAATLLGEPEAVRVSLQHPKVNIFATGTGYIRGGSVPFASRVSAIDIAREKLWPWADRNPGGVPVAEFDLILDMLMRRLHEECVTLAKLVVDPQQGVNAAEDTNSTGRSIGGSRTMLTKLKGLKVDTETLQCTGKPFVRELEALGRDILMGFSSANEVDRIE